VDKKVVIIGAGLGGLECGYILAKKGFAVTVLEKNPQPGGALQTFCRKDSSGTVRRFDCGFHYVGGLGEGESLERLFRWFGLMDLPWRRLNPDCFDELTFTGDGGTESYPFANGHERFAERLGEFFPLDREDLKKYTSFLKKVGDGIFDGFNGGASRLFEVNAGGWLRSTVKNPRLRNVLSGASLKMELRADSLPLYVFAQINDSYIRSAWRIEGGGGQIAEKLIRQIEASGGSVLCGKTVTSVNPDGAEAVSVTTSDGEVFEADYVIADIHPFTAVSLVGQTQAMRNIYRRRFQSLPDTFGIFTANIALKPGTIPYMDSNLYVHKRGANLWRPDPSRTDSVLVHFYPEGGKIDLLSPMSYSDLARWKGLPNGQRGADYEAVKASKAEQCLSLASARLPELRDAVSDIWTSTPLTWEDYTGTPEGSAYGLRKDFANPLLTTIPVQTPLKNMFLTGQNLNLHGLLGVSMTSVITCSHLLGDPGLGRQIAG